LITVATLLWSPNGHSQPFSAMYTDDWALKLLNGFARNLTREFEFVLFTDRARDLPAVIQQRPIKSAVPSYADCVQPFELDRPMILCGLDTLVTGNIDHLADYCLTADKIALPRDPYNRAQACNGVVLAPAGNAHVASSHRGENDMEHMRAQPHAYIDDLWPGAVQSWKGAVRGQGLGDSRVIYFHGAEKMHELRDNPIIREHWR